MFALLSRPFGPSRRDRGSVTVLFVMMACILVGAVSYSLIVGHEVEQRMKEQNATEASSLAMANHAAQGLNMIAANNLSIGASIQIMEASTQLAAYLAAIRLIAYDMDDLAEDMAAIGSTSQGPIQSLIYSKMRYMTMPFVSIATGITKLNDTLYDYWLYGAPMRGIEVARVNVPGSVMLPFQASQIGGKMESIWRYRGMSVTGPANTYCHAIRATPPSGGPVEISKIVDVLTAPLQTVGGPVKGLADAMHFIAHIGDGIFRIIGKFGLPTFGFNTNHDHCGTDLKFKMELSIPVPGGLQKWLGLPSKITLFDIQQDFLMQELGSQAGFFAQKSSFQQNMPLGNSQMGNPQDRLAKSRAQGSRRQSLGFLYPNRDSGVDGRPYALFQDSVDMIGLVVSPIRAAAKMGPQGCPAEWQRDGRCDQTGLAGFGGAGEGSGKYDDFNAASGGLNDLLKAAPASTTGPAGELDGFMSRLKYRTAQAKPEFLPSEDEAIDPKAAYRLTAERAPKELTTFWPAWRGRPTETKLLSNVLGGLARKLPQNSKSSAALQKIADAMK